MFGTIGAFLSSAASAVGTALTTAASAVASAVVPVVTTVATTLAPVVLPVLGGLALAEMFLSSDSSADDIKDIAQYLRLHVKQYDEACKRIEQQFKDRVRGYFDTLNGWCDKDEDLSQAFGRDQLLALQNRLLSKIDGAVSDTLSTKLSLDNEECRKIFMISDAEEREKKLNEYTRQAIDEGKANLNNVICDALQEQNDAMIKFLQTLISDKKRSLEESYGSFGSWIDDMDNAVFDQEKAQLKPRVKIYAIERIEQLVDDSERAA